MILHRHLPLLGCVAFATLLSVDAHAQCTPEQIMKMMDEGFTKNEVLQLCAPGVGDTTGSGAEQQRDEPPPTQLQGGLDEKGEYSLQDLWPFMGDDAWEKFTQDDVYVIQSEAGGRSTMSVLHTDANTFGHRHIAVDVRVRGAPSEGRVRGAGLLYAYSPEVHYALIFEPGGSLALIESGQEGYTVRSRAGTGAIDPDGFNRIEIVEDDNKIDMKVNGTHLGSFGDQNMGRGAIGIYAAGQGTFYFRNFFLSTR